MNECFLLLEGEIAEEGHKLFEMLLVILETLMLGLGEEVQDTDEALELIGVLGILREKVLV